MRDELLTKSHLDKRLWQQTAAVVIIFALVVAVLG